MPKKQETTLPQKLTLIILGLFLFFLSLEIGLRACAGLFLSLQERKNIDSIKHKDSYRIMCLGESTTVLEFGKDSYPAQLEEILNQSNTGIKFNVINKGVVNADTTSILEHLEENINKYNPDIVVTMMGVNDMNANFLDEKNFAAQRAIIFLKDLKVYKLANILWLHIAAKNVFSEQDNHLYFNLNSEFINKTKKRDFKKVIFLARYYRSEKNFPEAEKLYKEAISLQPQKARLYQELGWLYADYGRDSQTEELLKKAIELTPGHYQYYIDLGLFYKRKENFSKAETLFKKAIELNPKVEWVYVILGWLYNCEGKYSQAEEVFKKALELALSKKFKLGLFSESDLKYYQKLFGGLATLFVEMGNDEYARQYYGKANELRLKYLNPIMCYNYLKLKEILDKNNITFVCVQYPLRSVEVLKKIFNGKKGVIFVDNEKIFKEMVKKEGYNKYFSDLFAGDFGHCTRKGNALLAGNIAKVIMKECFNK